MNNCPLPNWDPGAEVTDHRAQGRRNTWVGDITHLRVNKCVKVGMPLRAELLSSSREIG